MKEKYDISIENKGSCYDEKKFKFRVEMTPEEFLSFCGVVINEFPELQTPDPTLLTEDTN